MQNKTFGSRAAAGLVLKVVKISLNAEFAESARCGNAIRAFIRFEF